MAPTVGVSAQLEALVARIAALEAAAGITAPAAPALAAPAEQPAAAEPAATDEGPAAPQPRGGRGREHSGGRGRSDRSRGARDDARRSVRARSACPPTPAGERVALHDEMIAVITERGPMTAGELATIIAERGRYTPPRSGKALDAAMVSQRVSNPAYRGRFTRDAGRIGLAE